MLSTASTTLAADVGATLADLVPDGVVVRAAAVPSPSQPWPADERRSLGVTRRSVEFATGRSLAAEALRLTHSKSDNVGRGDRGQPIWPEGFVGSITHCADVCAVAAANTSSVRSIGIDVERIEDVEDGLANLILRGDEDTNGIPLGWVFSAKESVFKCQYPLTREDAEFTDVRIHWAHGGRFRVQVWEARLKLAGRIEGTAAQVGPFVVTAAWLHHE